MMERRWWWRGHAGCAHRGGVERAAGRLSEVGVEAAGGVVVRVKLLVGLQLCQTPRPEQAAPD